MAKYCSIKGCDKPLIARGWCGMHYKRWRIYGDPLFVAPRPPLKPAQPRFWSKVLKADGCWEFQAKRDRDGYGRFWFEGKTRGAHVMAWLFTHGDIPVGLCVLHRCDNPSCCNPDHLFLGTIHENNTDRARKGRNQRPRDMADWSRKVSAASKGCAFRHRPDCDCRVCQGRRRNLGFS